MKYLAMNDQDNCKCFLEISRSVFMVCYQQSAIFLKNLLQGLIGVIIFLQLDPILTSLLLGKKEANYSALTSMKHYCILSQTNNLEFGRFQTFYKISRFVPNAKWLMNEVPFQLSNPASAKVFFHSIKSQYFHSARMASFLPY